MCDHQPPAESQYQSASPARGRRREAAGWPQRPESWPLKWVPKSWLAYTEMGRSWAVGTRGQHTPSSHGLRVPVLQGWPRSPYSCCTQKAEL